ncbi:MAG TPA: exonuclease [Methylophaga aminisulfidivorans]|uniref:Excinuclease cho n=2 Tax=root TaxID=1 RepID=A0A7C1W0D1_9GAMM|nr:exonuclease [Methylophaga aminisulfidivorans]
MILLDCETTGGRAGRDKITEIALIEVTDGIVTNRWQSLINPGINVPPWITSITGIDNSMLEHAPSFTDIAESLHDTLSGKVLVAHNARFDYSFLKQEFKRAGYDYSAKTLCSVKLSRRLFPQYKGHSLDKIIERFSIPTTGRHRAMADTEVILAFFAIVKQHIPEETIASVINGLLKRPSLPSHLDPSLIDNLPSTPGVYQFYDEAGVMLYIGKSINIKDRVLSHFSSDHSHHKELDISQQLHHIEWIETASDFGAQLLENEQIKQYSPRYNRRQTKTKKLFQLSKITNKEGYAELDVIVADMQNPQAITARYGLFRSKKQAQTKLLELINEHHLCQRLCAIEKKKTGPCFAHQLKKCRGACCQKEPSISYNLRVELALSRIKNQQWPWQGPILIEENASGHQWDKAQYHLVDQWCYLGKVRDEDDCVSVIEAHEQRPAFFDLDSYKILIRFLLPMHASKYPQLTIKTLTLTTDASINA